MRRLLLLTLLTGCVENLPPLDEITSLRVELAMPVDPGTKELRLPDTVTSAQIVVTAIDSRGEVADLDGPVKVYAQFLGTLTPTLGSAQPLATVMLTDGVSQPSTVMLPRVYGPTVLWVEDDREGGTFPTGTSPVLWFRDPYISDISTPRDPMALDALESSPLELKQVTVTGSRYGANGRLVVTGTYAQGYSLSDTMCADASGTPPCVAGDYDHILIFSFSRPRDEKGRNISAGQFTSGFSGGVQEFNGLTEIGFPQSFVAEEDPVSVNEARIPAPAVVLPSWLTNVIEFEKHESGLIQVNGGTVCPLDMDYTTYKQWKLDIGRGCGQAINVITTGVAEFDPATREGMALTRVVGVLRPVNIGTFNVWIIYPRTGADLTL
ncbi:MAG TPA: hypothetical protein VM261_33175 [Kofleriaceae bacterium]|nr:hypothetical protein [Kofleriaceae bacterium]